MLEKVQRLKERNEVSMEKRFIVRERLKSDWNSLIVSYESSAI